MAKKPKDINGGDRLGPAIAAMLLIGSLHPGLANELLRSLPADTWLKAPLSQLRSVCAPETVFPGIRGTGGCAMETAAWSGGAYDADGKKMWVWGGGHGDYWGNEIYSFDVESMKWTRVTSPSATAVLSVDPLPDGNPVARHTYDGLAYLGHVDRFFAYGGSMAGNGYGTQVTWTFDPKAKTWSNMQPAGNENRPATNCCNFTGEYDAETRKVYVRDPNWLSAYDVDKNAWTHEKSWSHSWGPGKTVVDTRRRLLITAGSKEFLVWDLVAKKDVSADWKTTGGDDLINGSGIGLAYDPKSDMLVGWMGGGVYALNMTTRIWTRKSGTGAPATGERNGTFGRFRYIPDDNVFILVNKVDEDVWFYKLTAGTGGVTVGLGKPEYRLVQPAKPGFIGLDGGKGPDHLRIDGRRGSGSGFGLLLAPIP